MEAAEASNLKIGGRKKNRVFTQLKILKTCPELSPSTKIRIAEGLVCVVIF